MHLINVFDLYSTCSNVLYLHNCRYFNIAFSLAPMHEGAVNIETTQSKVKQFKTDLSKALDDSTQTEDNPSAMQGDEGSKQRDKGTDRGGPQHKVLGPQLAGKVSCWHLQHHVAPEEGAQDGCLLSQTPRQHLRQGSKVVLC